MNSGILFEYTFFVTSVYFPYFWYFGCHLFEPFIGHASRHSIWHLVVALFGVAGAQRGQGRKKENEFIATIYRHVLWGMHSSQGAAQSRWNVCGAISSPNFQGPTDVWANPILTSWQLCSGFDTFCDMLVQTGCPHGWKEMGWLLLRSIQFFLWRVLAWMMKIQKFWILAVSSSEIWDSMTTLAKPLQRKSRKKPPTQRSSMVCLLWQRKGSWVLHTPDTVLCDCASGV